MSKRENIKSVKSKIHFTKFKSHILCSTVLSVSTKISIYIRIYSLGNYFLLFSKNWLC